MAPVPITVDYYMTLEVDQTATLELITRSYRRLALKLHPDRNAKRDATEAFQLLGRAYETLKDKSLRQAYDLIYPSVRRGQPSPQSTQTSSSPPPASPRQPEALSDAAQIAALQKSKQGRGVQWRSQKNAFDSSIFVLQKGIRRLEQAIGNLDSILAAEAAAEAQKNSWGTWLLSPIYKKIEESEEEKARKDRDRQERRVEKDMKERWLARSKAALVKEENFSKEAEERIAAADLRDDRKIQAIQARIRAREAQERQERERAEREEMAKAWKQEQELRQKRARELAETRRKQQAAERAAEEGRRQEKEIREWERSQRSQRSQRNSRRSGDAENKRSRTCRHDGWWPKIQGRTACPECCESWPYLLQCPGCKILACPRCQAARRPRVPRRAH